MLLSLVRGSWTTRMHQRAPGGVDSLLYVQFIDSEYASRIAECQRSKVSLVIC